MMVRVGIIGAMEEEIVQIKDKIQIHNTQIYSNMEFYLGQINNKIVIIVKCGVGKVNAAICTQVLIDRYNVDYIINTGVAGAVSEVLNIGDIVISEDVLYHDFDVTALGFDAGVIPWMPQSIFKADKKLINFAKEACNDLNNVFIGRIVSGDQFIRSEEKKEIIKNTFKPLCVEMEAAAIAHTCTMNDKPFVIIRAISDKANSDAEVNFAEFLNEAVTKLSLIIEKILQYQLS